MSNKPEESIVHIKMPRSLHMQLKIAAFESGQSMNEYGVAAVQEKLKVKVPEKNTPRPQAVSNTPTSIGISIPNIVDDDGREVVQATLNAVTQAAVDKLKLKGPVCKIHGTPLDFRGRCMQKGCKYA
jgi:hypothetical protein